MNYYKDFDFKQAEILIREALKEDLGKGDITSEILIPPDSVSKAELLVKENGIAAGLEIFRLVFRIIDRNVSVKLFKKDGEKVKRGEVIASVKGATRKLLSGERLALNILQRMSGIAGQVKQLSDRLGNPEIKITDTRKTTPNFRIFEKLAVKTGGGINHRAGLYDMILIKDNHIEANGGIANTIKILKNKKSKIKNIIEIEVKNIRELKIVLNEGADVIDRIMLDNFRLPDIEKAVSMNRNRFELEISGGVNLKNIGRYKHIKGVRYISSGSLTHSVKSLDISFNFIT